MSEPVYFPEGGRPILGDSDNRLLHKIAGSVYDAISADASSNIGVEIKDANSNARAKVTGSLAGSTDQALVVTLREQTVTISENQPDTVTVSAIVTANGDVLAANSNRLRCKIQNLDTEPLFIHEATGASATVFTEIAPACIAQDDGSSPPIFLDSKGVISVYAASTARCKVTEYV